MGTYSIDELVQRWYKQELTAEQAIGQLVQLLRQLLRRVDDLERRTQVDEVRAAPKRR